MKIPILPPGEIARRAVQAKESIKVAKQTRNVAKATDRTIKKAFGIEEQKKSKPEHGQQIFVFNHLQKNHVVYSLTRSMNNNAALAQLPFNGKKSVPAALRKDLWHPFAQIRFPPGAGTIGLSAFQKLREYRKRHELEWGTEITLGEDGKHKSLKERGKALCDQRANSVADMALVLSRLAPAPLEDGVETREEREKNIGLIGEGSGTQVEILWNNMCDAEFAEKWADNVVHAPMPAPTPSGGKRLLKKREIAALIRGEIAAKKELYEALDEKRIELERDRQESGIEVSAEQLEQEEAERRAEIAERLEEIKLEFRVDERNAFLEAEKKAEAAAKYARQVALEQRRVGADTFQGTPEEVEAAARAAAVVAGIVSQSPPSFGTSYTIPSTKTKSPASKVANESLQQVVLDPVARQAKKQAARDLYFKRQAEQAERKANDPEWYEMVKAEGMKRKAEKGLLAA
ncbi:uncharacterized protein RSE6_10663 [Rhynchosporium secalis]|uniref:Large ribosomal subunit protein mL67 n=1 Tax=Rhynchosporium secalis TaxID=38038 RepID=A0A1E1ML03_RHYSE|nr:uncharacterized protein RSE6_10663 [Rhynchosporium secalis]